MHNNIDILRKRANLTVQQLADAAGVTRGYLNKLKAGRARLNTDVLEALSKALNCSPTEIISSEEFAIKPSTVNQEIMQSIIEGLELLLNEEKVEITPANKAKAIALIYDRAIKKNRQEIAPEEARDELSLVIAAINE